MCLKIKFVCLCPQISERHRLRRAVRRAGRDAAAAAWPGAAHQGGAGGRGGLEQQLP